ncbi:MAG: phosphoribosylformylglycinamidine cyclo-ligase [Solirubrobacteraceae bacterium]|jgi:phosphoribosylformylglycinamidine cyclo-ligase|nr:phosphoribosylformylglycinamidine cyclo-ligase [Solirubrobacteraceae bacterium]
MSQGGASYRAAGVDYDALDAGKRLAMAKALSTSSLLAARGGRALDLSRGESAFVFELGDQTFAFVVEGLGTKSIIARQVLEGQGLDRFADVAYDAVAAILNDLCGVGALPLVVNAYFATGASEWYLQRERGESLLEGWRRACVDAGCVWGGGESPSLPGLLDEREIELAGAAVGAVPQGHKPILGDDLRPGDEIVLVASSGLHANGASLARLIAGRLPEGYATSLPDGKALGEALLEPSIMYVPLVAALLDANVPVTYISHITGHGLLKLMRSPRPLTYRVERLPEVPAVLSFLAGEAGFDAETAYSTFNMGSGLAVYCAPGAAESVVRLAERLGLDALVAGRVEEGPRQVLLEPVGVRFAGEQLELSPDQPTNPNGSAQP